MSSRVLRVIHRSPVRRRTALPPRRQYSRRRSQVRRAFRDTTLTHPFGYAVVCAGTGLFRPHTAEENSLHRWLYEHNG